MKTDFLDNRTIEFLSASSFLKPQKIHESSAWVQHVPFAFWLTEQLKPNVIVELGVHTGVSYFAFCQSVKINNLNTLCYGIDTWKGDAHSGTYDESIWYDVSGYNSNEYDSFSYLLRTTFYDALPYFEDASIDILHIDGLHTYEAVKEDFYNWLPKVSANGIVLFHDIAVRERQFGVFKFWQEIKKDFKHFEFHHGFGLGVIAVGDVPSNVLSRFFGLTIEEDKNIIRALYASLGNKWTTALKLTELHHLLHVAVTQKEQSNATIDQVKQRASGLEQENAATKTELELLKLKLDDLNTVNQNLLHELEAQKHHREEAIRQKELYEKEKQVLIRQLSSHEEIYSILMKEKDQLKNEFEQISTTIAEQKSNHEVSVAALREQIHALQLEKAKLLEKWNEMIQDLEKAQKKLAAYEQELSKLRNELAEQERKTSIQKQEGQAKMQQMQQTINHQQSRLSDLIKELADGKNAIGALHTELNHHNEILQWYNRTYEQRNIFGILKDKIISR